MRYTHVLWDWNGTLLNDVDFCVQTIDLMLAKRGLPVLGSLAAYHAVFRFPVIDYYREAGFDLEREPFEELAVEYMALYHHPEAVARYALHSDATTVLHDLSVRGLTQVVLSASERTNLLLQMSPFHITDCFDEILGISDIYARGKTEIGQAYMARNDVGRAVLIGDTTHDYEVARALGADCLLVARGHQSRETLQGCGVPVLESLLEAAERVFEGK